MTGSHIARWARRKRDARKAATSIQRPPSPGNVTAQALPAVDEITAQTDIRAFLQPGVPAGLRKAALRRAWLVDPAIRDFAGPARDYDYDWTRADGRPAGGTTGPQRDDGPVLADGAADSGGTGDA